MSLGDQTSRRGAALLLTLAALAITLAACAVVARSTATLQSSRRLERDSAAVEELLHSAEAPILSWLAEESDRVVLPPDSTEPRVQVLQWAWQAAGRESELTVTAWDQCGMVPLHLARAGSPLRLTLPEHVRTALDRVQLSDGHVPGLDLLDSAGPIFPRARSSATGAHIATANQQARINIHTAPMPLVQAALTAAGLGGADLIRQARAEGRRLPMSSLTQFRAGGPDSGPVAELPASQAPMIASTSSAWAVRIDARVGTVRRSWWAVYCNQSPSWRCVQRLVVRD